MDLTVGIDLGTTYTVVACIDSVSKKPVILKNRNGNSTTPSVVGMTYGGGLCIGEDAKNMEEIGDINTASFYKLHMGDHDHKIVLCGGEYTAKDLSSMFLKQLIKEIEGTIGDKITRAVITVPAYFEDAARNDTLEAGRAAGLDVINIISEPTAACVAFGLNKDGKNKKVLIYDLGGGTFDVTIAEIKNREIKVLGTQGLHELGGRDWDKAVTDWFQKQFYEETGTDISGDSELAAINMIKAEKAKKQLTMSQSVEVTITDDIDKVKVNLTRELFENLTAYQLDLTKEVIENLMADINVTWSDLDGAVLVGGSTKMPMVHDYINAHGIDIAGGVNVDEAVAVGAAIQANISNYCALDPADRGKSSLLTLDEAEMDLELLPGATLISDVISHSLGMIMANEDMSEYVNDIMIKRNTSCNDANTTKRRELRVGKKTENNKLDIYLLQGESRMPLECSIAKKYVFDDIDFVSGGKSMIDIRFSHTINGTIAVDATQVENGKALRCTETPVETDLSWLTRSPKENLKANTVTVNGTIVMALDVSGSMCGNPLVNAKKAMCDFVEMFEETDIEFAVVAFSDRYKPYCNPTSNRAEVIKAINDISIGTLCGYGNECDPTGQMLDILKNSTGGEFMYGIVLTDGVWDYCALTTPKLNKAKYIKAGYELVGMGFGGADLKFLREISTRSDLAKVTDVSRLGESLSSIARIINN